MSRTKRLRSFYHGAAPRQGGFSLVELLVTVVIMAEVMVGMSILFDGSNRLARAQTELAEIQQTLRVGQSELVRFVRTAGIGGLPITRLNLDNEPDATSPEYGLVGAFPRSGYAVSVHNNVIEGNSDQVIGPDQVVPGSDVLIVRGVFTTPLYYLDPPLDISSWMADGNLKNTNPPHQRIVISENVRIVGKEWEDFPQDLSTLATQLLEAKNASTAEHRPAALILRDTLNPNVYLVMEFDHQQTTAASLDHTTDCAEIPATAVYASGPKCIDFFVRLDPDASAPEPGLAYANLTTGTRLMNNVGGTTLALPTGDSIALPTTIGSIGLLEEYRFFIRAGRVIPGDSTSDLRSVLSRSRFLPGTEVRLERVDIADDVIDLQIAIGIDTDARGSGVEYGRITDNGDAADEVLFNHPDDTVDPNPASAEYKEPPNGETWYNPALEFHFLRINTLVQSRGPDRNHRAPDIVQIEDFNRGASFELEGRAYRYNVNRRQYHRRWLQTIVELRNLL